MNDPFSWMFGYVPERFCKWMYLNKIECNGTFTWTFHFAERSDTSQNVQERLYERSKKEDVRERYSINKKQS